MKRSNYHFIGLVLFLIIGLLFSACAKNEEVEADTNLNNLNQSLDVNLNSNSQVNIKSFDIVLKEEYFDENIISVQKGDKVILSISNANEDELVQFIQNDLAIDVLIPSGKTEIVTFDATKIGEFEIECGTNCAFNSHYFLAKIIIN